MHRSLERRLNPSRDWANKTRHRKLIAYFRKMAASQFASGFGLIAAVPPRHPRSKTGEWRSFVSKNLDQDGWPTESMETPTSSRLPVTIRKKLRLLEESRSEFGSSLFLTSHFSPG